MSSRHAGLESWKILPRNIKTLRGRLAAIQRVCSVLSSEYGLNNYRELLQTSKYSWKNKQLTTTLLQLATTIESTDYKLVSTLGRTNN